MTKPHRLLSALTAIAASVALALSPQTAPEASALTFGAPSGVDVAGHQHPNGAGINFRAVKADGQDFVFVKATEGTNWVNRFYTDDARAAVGAGMKVGAYHYARPAFDAREQAANFAAQLALVPNQTLPPVLDLEVAEGKNPRELAQWTREFIGELEARTGRTPMIYTYRYFWQDQMANTDEFSQYPLWLAAYQNHAPEPVGGWDTLAFWQRSDNGRVNGITGPVDMNLFNGSSQQLGSFSAGNLGNIGGKLEGLVIPGGPDLGRDATGLIGVILALGAGAAAAPALVEAARQAGLGDGAGDLVEQVQLLVEEDALPVAQLRDMAEGDYTVGDLAILLDNAGHISGADADVDAREVNQAADIARGAGMDIPDFDATQVAGLVSRLAQRAG